MKAKITLLLATAAVLATGCGLLSGGSSNLGLGTLGTGTLTNPSRTFTFNSLPQTVEDLVAIPGSDLKDPYAVAALTVLALTRYETSVEDCYEMLNYLKGPEPLSNYEKSFIRDRFEGKKYYKVMSYFKGTSPDNNYTPSLPYTITIKSNPYSFQNAGWCSLFLHSSGADSDRPVKLRQKPSTGQWFLNEIQFLSDIRTPAAQDKWY